MDRNLKRIVSWYLKPDSEINENDLVLVTACDSVYFEYAVSLARSADFFSPGAKVLIHLINPEKNILIEVDQLRRVLKNTSLFVSIEKTGLDFLSLAEKKTYYACARFLRVEELLTEFACELLVVDSDSLIINQIDQDFTDKEEADICLIRRDLDGPPADVRMAVATGTIYIRNRSSSLKFFKVLTKKIKDSFADKRTDWFLDQILFYETMADLPSSVVRNIKRSYADWTFRKSSILWSGKGDLKTQSLIFSGLQKLLSLDEFVQHKALTKIYTFLGHNLVTKSHVAEKVMCVKKTLKPRAIIFLPRLDLPWKKPANYGAKISVVSNETLELRLWWKLFATNLVSAFQADGFFAETVEIPAWEITESAVNDVAADITFIPHRCHKDFDIAKVKADVQFYMQEYFSWVFVINRRGWSASSTIYPVNIDFGSYSFPSEKYEQYHSKLKEGSLQSKFAQKSQKTISQLIVDKQLPGRSGFFPKVEKFIFFPLQIPTDQSIRYFSSVEELDVVNAILDWSANSKVPVVFKPHPANEKSMQVLLELIRAKGGMISHANIHDLISYSAAVFTINSGVGFEALMHNKPIVTFGRVEYDCVTFKAHISRIDEAWFYCSNAKPKSLVKSYSAFLQWFLVEYAFDLSNKSAATEKLRLLVKRTKNKMSKS